MNNVISLRKESILEKKYIRAKDIQKIFGIARSTVDNWARQGFLIRHKVGRNIFYDVVEVELLQRGL
jgi:phage terminase Nu1 subunit (DNA packaging protein)